MKKDNHTLNYTPRIVFIGNDTGRTGAPIILLEIARHLNSLGWRCTFVFERDGVLTEQFKQVGNCYFWYKNLDSITLKPLRWVAKFSYMLGIQSLERFFLKQKIKRIKPDLIYANTGVTGYLLKEFKHPRIPALMHIHEMQSILRNFCGHKFTQGILHTDRFIVVNKLIKDNLITEYKIPLQKIEVIPAFMPYSDTRHSPEKKENAQFIVGSAGMPSFRKGTDLFIKVAALTKKICGKKILFRWVGFNPEDSSNYEYQCLIKELEIDDIIELIPHTATPLLEFAKFDIFLLSSREDPNPLVVLESGQLGKPVLSFKGSGATDEIVEAGGGTMVAMESIEEMATAIVEYMRDPALRKQKSQRIEKVIRENYSKKIILKKITYSIKKLIQQ